jgi:hypothetical protein
MPEQDEFEQHIFTRRDSGLPHDYFNTHERFRHGMSSLVMLALVVVVAVVYSLF